MLTMLHRYTLTNKHDMKVQVITYGARVISISVPDRHGDIADVILGCDKVSGQITALCFS